MKVTLIRNWYDSKANVLRYAGEEVEIPDDIAKKMVEEEKKAGEEFVPYFAGTQETKDWLKAVAARNDACKKRAAAVLHLQSEAARKAN